MARNKKGQEMAAGYKTKEDVQLAKTTGAYAIEIAENIHESSSTEENPNAHKARKERKAERARRRAARHNKLMGKASSSTSSVEKRYDILAQYHQLNYSNIQAALKDLNVAATLIDNTRLWIMNVAKEEYEKIRDALIKCHFETKQHKQYRVRVAGYKHVDHTTTGEKKKKPTNNKPEVALAAKKKRKIDNVQKKLQRKKHTTGRKAEKANHKPGVLDTSSIVKKLRNRVKKACRTIVHKEKDRAAQAKSRASKPITQKRKGQQKLEFAA